MAWKIMQGDVRDKLAELPEKSVHCVVTSPPYWGLRSYLPDGHEDKKAELGLEKTPEEYVQNMVEVFRGVWRVLRDDGVVWLNLGDSYAQSGGSGSGEYQKRHKQFGKTIDPGTAQNSRKAPPGLKPKDLVGIPWRVAFALQSDGWYLRSDIIWAKPNPMPESVTDRPTKAHEYIFLLTKKQKYFYDAEAIKEKQSGKIKTRRFSSDGGAKARAMGKHISGGNEGTGAKWTDTGSRNKRTVWTVSTQPYPEAHFATFPPKLIEPCILAGTSPRACEICGSPWERVVVKGDPINQSWAPGTRKAHIEAKGKHGSTSVFSTDVIRPNITTGWQPTCTCQNEGKGCCIVLDPFAGSGTTLYVAEQHGRDSIGIELSPEYCKLINKRMDKMQLNIFNMGVSE